MSMKRHMVYVNIDEEIQINIYLFFLIILDLCKLILLMVQYISLNKILGRQIYINDIEQILNMIAMYSGTGTHDHW